MVEARKPATTPAQASNCVVKCVQKIDIDGHATYSYHIYGERIRKVLQELLRDYFAPAFHEGEPLVSTLHGRRRSGTRHELT